MKPVSLCLTILSAFIVLSCTQKINSNIGIKELKQDRHYSKVEIPKTPDRKVADHLTAFEEKTQIFNIDPTNDTTIIGKKGTSVTIHAYCLVREDGAEISGLVKIELQELYSKADMILQNKPTVSNGKLLESNGEIYLNASNNGKKLKISCQDGISVALASPARMDMEMWLGEINNEGDINWQQDSTITPVANNNYIEESYEDNYVVYDNGVNNFLFKTNKFGWINCDKFYSDSSEKVELYVQMKNPFPKEYQTYVYIVFPELNSVLQAYSADGENYSVSGIPLDKEVKIISVSATETKTFFDMKEVKVKKGMKETAELQPMAKADIVRQLEGL